MPRLKRIYRSHLFGPEVLYAADKLSHSVVCHSRMHYMPRSAIYPSGSDIVAMRRKVDNERSENGYTFVKAKGDVSTVSPAAIDLTDITDAKEQVVKSFSHVISSQIADGTAAHAVRPNPQAELCNLSDSTVQTIKANTPIALCDLTESTIQAAKVQIDDVAVDGALPLPTILTSQVNPSIIRDGAVQTAKPNSQAQLSVLTGDKLQAAKATSRIHPSLNTDGTNRAVMPTLRIHLTDCCKGMNRFNSDGETLHPSQTICTGQSQAIWSMMTQVDEDLTFRDTSYKQMLSSENLTQEIGHFRIYECVCDFERSHCDKPTCCLVLLNTRLVGKDLPMMIQHHKECSSNLSCKQRRNHL